MKTRRTADRSTTRIVDNDVHVSNLNVIPLHGANSETTTQDTSILRLRPVLQAVALTRDLIAERAKAIWLKRGCPSNRDEENWREAEAQLKTELGVV
jgi:hypothetical protein